MKTLLREFPFQYHNEHNQIAPLPQLTDINYAIVRQWHRTQQQLVHIEHPERFLKEVTLLISLLHQQSPTSTVDDLREDIEQLCLNQTPLQIQRSTTALDVIQKINVILANLPADTNQAQNHLRFVPKWLIYNLSTYATIILPSMIHHNQQSIIHQMSCSPRMENPLKEHWKQLKESLTCRETRLLQKAIAHYLSIKESFPAEHSLHITLNLRLQEIVQTLLRATNTKTQRSITCEEKEKKDASCPILDQSKTHYRLLHKALQHEQLAQKTKQACANIVNNVTQDNQTVESLYLLLFHSQRIANITEKHINTSTAQLQPFIQPLKTVFSNRYQPTEHTLFNESYLQRAQSFRHTNNLASTSLWSMCIQKRGAIRDIMIQSILQSMTLFIKQRIPLCAVDNMQQYAELMSNRNSIQRIVTDLRHSHGNHSSAKKRRSSIDQLVFNNHHIDRVKSRFEILKKMGPASRNKNTMIAFKQLLSNTKRASPFPYAKTQTLLHPLLNDETALHNIKKQIESFSLIHPTIQDYRHLDLTINHIINTARTTQNHLKIITVKFSSPLEKQHWTDVYRHLDSMIQSLKALRHEYSQQFVLDTTLNAQNATAFRHSLEDTLTFFQPKSLDLKHHSPLSERANDNEPRRNP